MAESIGTQTIPIYSYNIYGYVITVQVNYSVDKDEVW